MADSDKNIVISPQRGSASIPSVTFTGQGNDPITLKVLDGTPGTLSFEGSAGELFRLTNSSSIGSSLAYGLGETYVIWNDNPEVAILDAPSAWRSMKSFVASKSGNLRLKFSGYIESGTYYWAWRIINQNASVVASGHYNSGLDTGETTSVHAYRRFVADLTTVQPGDEFTLQMVSADSSGNALLGVTVGQRLFAKEFRAYSTTPSLDHGGTANVWGKYVGIGTTLPTSSLHVESPWSASSSTNDIATFARSGNLVNCVIGYDEQLTDMYIGTKTSHSLQFRTGDARRVIIDTSGNVGIGTTNPYTPLYINNATPTVTLNSTTGGNFGLKLQYNYSSAHGVNITYTPNDATAYIENVYNTVPGTVYGDIYFRQRENSSPVTRMTIKADGGNIGIATTNPSSRLAVNGYITESTNGGTNYWNVVTQQDIGTSPNQVPLNQYLGQLAFLDDFSPNGLRREGGSTDDAFIDSAGTFSVVGGRGNITMRSVYNGLYNGLFLNGGASDDDYNLLSADADKSLYVNRPSGLNIYFREGNTTQATIFSGGNVGIGTDGATTKLHVYGSTTIAKFQASNSYVDINLANSTSSAGYIQYMDSNLRFFAASTSVPTLVITGGSPGNVGIGTTNPQKLLEVISNSSDYVSIGVAALAETQWCGIHFGYRENNTAYRKSVLAFERIDSAARGKIHILNNNDNNSNSATLADSKLTIQSDGNVGIGTTNPAYKLHVYGVDAGVKIGPTYSPNDRDNIILQTGGTESYIRGNNNKFGFYNNSGDFVFYVDSLQDASTNPERFRIGADGHVGIGTVIDIVPYDTLNNGTLSFEGSAGQLFSITNNLTSGSIFSVNDVSGIPSIDVDANGTVSIAPYSGNVGIGTASPLAKLHVVNTTLDSTLLYLQGNNNRTYEFKTKTGSLNVGGERLDFYAGSVSAEWSFTTSNGERLRINGSGNVGIGTNDPTQKLDVNGSVRIRSGFYDNNNSTGNSGDVLTSTGFGGFTWAAPAGGGGGGGEFSLNGSYGGTIYSSEAGNGGYGTGNFFGGYSAGYSNTSGSNNTFISSYSGTGNSTGQGNTAIGYFALAYNQSGSHNTFIGTYAGNGNNPNHNIGLGYNAGNGSSGSNNLFFGCSSGTGASGLCDVTTESNHIIMGNSSHTTALIQVGWTTVSDCRDKCIFGPVPHGRGFLQNIDPVEYAFKNRETGELKDPEGKRRYGFVAQNILETEGTEPVIVNADDPENLKLTSDYIIPILVNAIKELSQEVETLKSRLDILENS